MIRVRRLLFALFRLRAHIRDRAGRCICCGVGGSYIPDSVCWNCYWRWTFEDWRPWWLRLDAAGERGGREGE